MLEPAPTTVDVGDPAVAESHQVLDRQGRAEAIVAHHGIDKAGANPAGHQHDGGELRQRHDLVGRPSEPRHDSREPAPMPS